MCAVADGPSFAVRPLAWGLLFARRHDWDLEFTETWMDRLTTIGSPPRIPPPKPFHHRPRLWVLLCLLIGVGTYVTMEPEMVMDYLWRLLDRTQAPQPAVAQNLPPPTGAPSKQPEADWSFLGPVETAAPTSPTTTPTPTASARTTTSPTTTSLKQPEQDWSFLGPAETPTAPASASAPTAQASARTTTSPTTTSSAQPEPDWSFLGPVETAAPTSPTTTPTPTASAPTTSPAAAQSAQPEQDWSFLSPDETPSPSSQTASPSEAAAASKQPERSWSFGSSLRPMMRERMSVSGTREIPVPMFHEGQRVRVRPDLNAPGWSVLLRQDAEGTMAGATILPGSVLAILDGDLQGRNWVYFVRSDIGSEGWLTEGQLRPKR